MEMIDGQLNKAARSWTRRAERRHPSRVEYYSELRSWIQRAIIEAEKSEDLDKKDQLLNLLKDL